MLVGGSLDVGVFPSPLAVGVADVVGVMTSISSTSFGEDCTSDTTSACASHLVSLSLIFIIQSSAARPLYDKNKNDKNGPRLLKEKNWF